jgi:hypothetical protein
MMATLWIAFLACAADATPTVKIEPDKDARVRVTAVLPEALAKKLPRGEVSQEQGEARLAFALVNGDSGKAGPAMFGKYQCQDGKLVFVSRHALAHGQRYRATLYLDDRKTVTADYTVPAKKVAGDTRVEKVYPTSDVLPANQLKFYIYFSRSMRESRSIFDHMHILDDKGKPVDDPWRRTELWSDDGKRLTLWIHPGRIKKGVNLNVEIGPVLEPERSYTLVIDAKLLDTDGQPLVKSFHKKFKTTKPERDYVALEDWKLTAPKEGTRDAVVLTFPKPHDHALLKRFIQILGKDKKPVAGRIELGKEEKSLSFVPTAAWPDGAYQVVVDGRLEDLAGNTPDQLFDVDNEEADAKPVARTLSFRPTKK